MDQGRFLGVSDEVRGMAEGAQAHEPRMLCYDANVRWAAAADADIAP